MKTIIPVPPSPGFTLILTLTFSFFVLTGAMGQDCLQYEDYFHWVNNWSIPYPGEVVDLKVEGDLVFAACYGEGLKILDISHPFDPEIIGELPTQRVAGGVDLAGGLAYVVDYESGLLVVDIQDPENPVVVGSSPTPSSAFRVTIAGHFAYLSGGPEMGLQVIDVLDPEAPVFKGGLSFPGGFTRRVVVSGDHAFVAGGNGSSVYVVDVSNPENLNLVATIDTPDFTTDVAIDQGVLYVGHHSNRMDIFDVTIPEAPLAIGSLEMAYPEFPSSVMVSNGVAFVGCGVLGGFLVVDVSSPESPVVIQRVFDNEIPFGFDLAENTLLVACSRMEFFDVTSLEEPPKVGSIHLVGLANDVKVSGNHAFVAGSDFNVVDVSSPDDPQLVVRLEDLGTCSGLALSQDHAFLLAGSDFIVLDISNLQDIKHMATLDLPFSLRDIEIVDDRAFCTSFEYTFWVINISDPESPYLEASLDDTGLKLDVAGDFAYVTGIDPLKIIDISEPGNPFVCSQVPLSGVRVAVGDGIAFLKSGVALHMLDVQNPYNPSVLGSMVLAGAPRDMILKDQILYLASRGLQVLDVSNPLSPVFLGISPHLSGGVGMDALGEAIFVADNLQGLKILPAQCGGTVNIMDPPVDPDGSVPFPGRFSLVASPNPFNPMISVSFNLDRPGHVQTQIFDVKGELIQELSNGLFPAGMHTMTWSGMDTHGHDVSSGTYLVRMNTETQVLSRKISLVR